MTCETHQRLGIVGQPIPKQDPEVRIRNWDETFLGFDLETAKVEAARCIQCPAAPCQDACPVSNDIPGAFALLQSGNVTEAANKFRETSNLPDMCGRLCPQEQLCEGACVVAFAIRPESFGTQPPVAIGKLEAFVTDQQRQNEGLPMPEMAAPTGRRVAVVGAGPAGLAAAEELAKRGHSVTLFDAWPQAGGVLVYGIPNFKMRKEILQEKLDYLWSLGVEFIGDTYIGRNVTVDELFERGYESVFLAHGASLGNQLDVPGADLPGVIMATQFLVQGNLQPNLLPESLRGELDVGDKVIVVGGGDTSMDCVRTAVRLSAKEVTCAYRRTEAEQTGRVEERKHAVEEGVRFEYLASPVRFEAGPDGRVGSVLLARMALGEPDASGRRRPEPTGEQFTVEAETVVLAIGYGADADVIRPTEGIETNRSLVEVDPETFETSRPGVFAGGDCVNGADLVVTALADGRRAAEAIGAYLEGLPQKDASAITGLAGS